MNFLMSLPHPQVKRPHRCDKATPCYLPYSEMSIGAVFKLNPYPVPDGFKWDGDKFHYTWAWPLSKERCLAVVRRATSNPLWYSWVQEISPEGHEHTHMALMFASRLRLIGSRHFDVPKEQGEYDPTQSPQSTAWHPNVQKMNATQTEVVWMHYHHGRKYNPETNKIEFIEPIAHHATLPPNFEWNRAIMQEMITAPTLREACIAGQIRARSVADVKTLRAEPEPVNKQFAHQYTKDQFTLSVPSDFTCLHAHGPTNLGKTKCMLAQAKNPLFVKPFDSVGQLEKLKNFDPKVHDMIICDEADLRFLTRQQAIAFADFDEDCTITVRFTSVDIPKGTKKIIISNPSPEQLWPHDPSGAIMRRIQPLHITTKTFGPQPPQPPPLQPPRPPLPPPRPQPMSAMQTARAALAAGWSAADLAAAVRN